MKPSVLLVAFSGLLCLGTAAPTALAQAPNAKVEFTFRMGPDEPGVNLKDSPIYLRPNAPLPVELLLKNTEANKFANGLREVTVKLMRVDGGNPTPLTSAKVDKLLPGDETRLVFAADKVLAEL